MSVISLIAEFQDCLRTMSHSRAGWDYQLPPDQRHEESRQEHEALARARAIWAENPAIHDGLRVAFTAANPLATMKEIETP
jgi:hypothetical protein